MLPESFRGNSGACDKLLMGCALQALAKGQMSNAESLWLPGASEPILEASMENWQDGIQQQQEPHVFWAPALCLCIRPAPQAQQYPMGSRSPVAAQTSPLFHSPTASASLPPPQAQSGRPPSLLPLRSGGVGRKSAIPSLSAAAINMNRELLVPRPKAEDGRQLKKHLVGKILDKLLLKNFLALNLS